LNESLCICYQWEWFRLDWFYWFFLLFWFYLGGSRF